MADQDLTGIWQGLYTYGGLGHRVGFTATLLETGGAVWGTTHEHDPQLGSVDLDASLAGKRAGMRVAFTKTYEAAGEGFLPVHYDGTISGDGTEVEGTWAIHGGPPLSGRFLMSRPHRKATSAKARKTVSA